ncbi:MAG TPA: hypothetical protein VFV70_07025, partial [Hyphomonadaceae bacterium]|nr:hypothetical protein [Hyphomonadaceae bacterium]
MTRFIAIAPAILLAPAVAAQTPDHSGHEQHPPPAQQEIPQDHSRRQPPADPHASHGESDRAQMDHSKMDHGAGMDAHAMASAFGSYALQRDASGTSWVPDASTHDGVHATAGDWLLMGHATLDGVYSWQDGPRGDEKAFIGGMFMGTAQRRFDNGGVLQFRGMLSPDPFMGKRGYPLLLAAGETADGVEPLVDRQHPHDLFMELSASYSVPLSEEVSVFGYAGLPGEPAFGPPAFMHR